MTSRVDMHDFISERERLAACDEAVLVVGAVYESAKRSRNRPLGVVRTQPEIAELAELVTDCVPGDGMAWMESPALSIAFLQNRRVVSTYGILSGGGWVRTPAAEDRKVRGAERLRDRCVRLGADLT